MRALLYRGFAVFHAAFPVDGVVADLGRTAQCCFIWHGFCHKVDTREFPHGIAIVNSILGGWVRQVEPDLKQIHLYHISSLNGSGNYSEFPL